MAKQSLVVLIGMVTLTAFACSSDPVAMTTAGTSGAPTAGSTAPKAGTNATAGSTSPTAGSTSPTAGRTSPTAGSTSPTAGSTSTAGSSAGTTAAAGSGGSAAGSGGAKAGSGGAGGSSGGAFALTSSSVMNGQMLPDKHRCVALGGETGPSPQLSWTAGPAGTMSYAVTLTDKGNGYAHWTIYDIPASATMLPEGVPQGASPAMPAGAKQAQNENSFVGGPGYFGPCAGLGTYEFKVYALDAAMLTGLADSKASTVRAALQTHSVGTATLSIMSGN